MGGTEGARRDTVPRLPVWGVSGVLSMVGLQSLPCLPGSTGQDELFWARGLGTVLGRAQFPVCHLASPRSHLSLAEEDRTGDWRSSGHTFKSKGTGLNELAGFMAYCSGSVHS